GRKSKIMVKYYNYIYIRIGYVYWKEGVQMKRTKCIIGMILLGMEVGLFTFSGCGSNQTDLSLAEGMQYIERLDYQSALAAFQTAEKNGEDERLTERGLGIVYMGLTNYDSAIESFLQCLSLSDGIVEEMDYDVNFYLAAAYQKAGKYNEAEKVYDAILAMRPQDIDAYYLRGNARLSQDKYETAKEDFNKEIVLEPYNFGRLIEIYEVLSAHGYKQIGEEYLETALSQRDAKMTALDKGKINYYLCKYEQAQVFLEDAKSTGEAEAFLYLGMAYEATGDYNYAIKNVYTSYLNRNKENPQIYNQLGLCYMKQEDYSSALSAFQSAMQIADNEMIQALQFNEIVAYEFLGEYTQAAVLLGNYIKMYPDDEAARREYGFLSTR
ncbi:MAG TPA: tetratricopeptide repeat protein, partial [Lachnospiraceae bacterium]|nr:tetratricopeptide repeat protein [Lachnospiraceae bacterium]